MVLFLWFGPPWLVTPRNLGDQDDESDSGCKGHNKQRIKGGKKVAETGELKPKDEPSARILAGVARLRRSAKI